MCPPSSDGTNVTPPLGAVNPYAYNVGITVDGGAGNGHDAPAVPTQSAPATPPTPGILKRWPLFNGGFTSTANVGSSPMNRSPLFGFTANPSTNVYADTLCPGFSSES